MRSSDNSQIHPLFALKSGATLIEITVVLLLILSLVGIGSFATVKISEWRLGREAGETLRTVYSAQRMFLADRPTTVVSSITAAELIPYLPGNMTAIPTVESLEGTQLSIIINTIPPVVDAGGGAIYDPSGSTSDTLWDIGQ